MTTLFNTQTKQFTAAALALNTTDLEVLQKDILRRLAQNEDKDIPEQYLASCELVKHIVERAAQQKASMERVVGELKGVLEEERLKSILQYYQVFTQQLLKKLDRSPLIPHHLADVHWRLHLALAQDHVSKILNPTCLMQFNLTDSLGKESGNFTLEFNHDQLYELFNQLEEVQEQLDALT